jgi:short-subunit dehydrogenase
MMQGFLDQDWTAARRVVDTNITGTIYLIQKIGRDMRAQGDGKILITGSIARIYARVLPSGLQWYGAFLDSLSYALRES